MLTQRTNFFFKEILTPLQFQMHSIFIEVQDQPMGIQNTHLFQLIQGSSQ